MLEKNKTRIVELKNRKKTHYSLIFCVIALQILLIFLFITESSNEKKLAVFQNNINTAQTELNRAGQTKKELLEVQNALFKSIYNGNNFDNYYSSLNGLNQKVDSLNNFTKSKKEYISSLKTFDTIQTSNVYFKEKIDSLVNNNDILKKTKLNPALNFSKFDYNEVLKSLNIESYMKVDSVAKKGFFSRIGNALAGKVDVQKEKVNVIITLKVGDKVSKGNIEDQFKNILQNTTTYYTNQFSKFKNQINQIEDSKKNIIHQNDNLIIYSNALLNLYDKAITEIYQNNHKEFQKQYTKNKETRYTILIGIVILMILISMLIFAMTQFAYHQERELKESKINIEKNVVFKNRLIGMLSHEIRSPLSIISIYINLISKKVNDEETTSLFKPLQFTAQSLLLLSNQILQYSKNENKQLELSSSSFNLTEETSTILTSLTEMTANNNNKLAVTNNLSTNLFVVSDKIKIYQLFYNLIGNANKFTSNGIIQVDLNAKSMDNKICNLDVMIKDNGDGISESDLPLIFNPFYKGNSSNNVSALGSGLGLNLCKEIVTLFEGEIKAESEIGKGTTIRFNIKLPLK